MNKHKVLVVMGWVMGWFLEYATHHPSPFKDKKYLKKNKSQEIKKVFLLFT